MQAADATDPDAPDPDAPSQEFLDAIGPVRRLRPMPHAPERPRPSPTPRMAERDDSEARGEFRRLLEAPPLDPSDPLAWRRDDIPPRTLRRLARGEFAAQDELDLHHLRVHQAEQVLRGFLAEALHEGRNCVRIIHGKGLNSEGTPVLKNLVDRMLRQRADVLAFHSAPALQGGTGAVLVLLRPR